MGVSVLWKRVDYFLILLLICEFPILLFSFISGVLTDSLSLCSLMIVCIFYW